MSLLFSILIPLTIVEVSCETIGKANSICILFFDFTNISKTFFPKFQYVSIYLKTHYTVILGHFKGIKREVQFGDRIRENFHTIL